VQSRWRLRKSSLAAIALAIYVMPSISFSQTSITARRGMWEAYSGISNTPRTPICGISARGRDRSLHIKFFQDNPENLIIQIFKDGWSIPRNTVISARISIDRHEGWTVNRALGDGRKVEWLVPSDVFDEFANLFMAGRRMFISFPQGDEAPWEINLTGSSAIFSEFARCIVSLEPSGRPTQPFRQGIPNGYTTQPFQASPNVANPTQPFSSFRNQPKD